MIKAIALLSGGLDSILAARLILEQGIEVEAVNFVRGQEVVTTPERPKGRYIIQGYGRKTGKFFREIIFLIILASPVAVYHLCLYQSEVFLHCTGISIPLHNTRIPSRR